MLISHVYRKYALLVTTSLASKIAYPLDVLMRSVFFAVVLYIFTQLWSALLGSQGNVLGFTKVQLVWYLMVTESIMLSNARIERRIEDDIKTGTVAYTLIRPLHFVWYQCSVYCGESFGHFVFNALVGTLVAVLLAGAPPLPWPFLPAVALVMLLAFLLQFFVKMSIALLAFFVEDTGPFFWVYSKILFTVGGLFVPLDMYPEWLRRIALALPFNFVLYQPARLFVAFDTGAFLSVVAAQVLWIALLMGLAFFIYGQGVKRINVNGG